MFIAPIIAIVASFFTILYIDVRHSHVFDSSEPNKGKDALTIAAFFASVAVIALGVIGLIGMSLANYLGWITLSYPL